jgi:hypothetical protein
MVSTEPVSVPVPPFWGKLQAVRRRIIDVVTARL